MLYFAPLTDGGDLGESESQSRWRAIKYLFLILPPSLGGRKGMVPEKLLCTW